MEIYTLDRGFMKQDPVIDTFESVIWTDRYYGDGDFELNVPATDDMLQFLPKGQLILCDDSDEPMILETRDIKDGILKTTGIALSKWLNSRIVRGFAGHDKKEMSRSGQPGVVMISLVQDFAMPSAFSSGAIPIGIPTTITSQFPVPGLVIGPYDNTGAIVDFMIPFGQLYDILHDIATTYEVGMRIVLDYADFGDYQISYRSYRGKNRTSAQSVNPVVQFSKAMDSFTDIHDLESIEDYKTLTLMFASSASELGPTVGQGVAAGGMGTGFDLRVFQGWSDLNSDAVGADTTRLNTALTQQAATEIKNHKAVQLVDGEIVQVEGAKYGTDFFMGDLVEVVGNTGVLQTARVTEYIRSQDSAGERSYPGLTFLD